MSATEVEIAWLAGFLDGEGTIGISRSNSKSAPRAYLRPHLQAPNTDKCLIDHMTAIIEKVTGKKQSITHHVMPEGCKPMWRTQVHTQWECAMLIPLLLPHIISKKRQAQIVLEFCQRKLARQSYKWHEFRDLDEAGYAECLALNKRGTVKAEVQSPPILSLVSNA